MDRIELIKALVCSLVIIELLGLFACSSDPDGGSVADVNGYRITEKEFSRYIKTQIPDLSQPSEPGQARMLRLTVLREIVDRHIMLQQAEQLGLRAKDTEVEARLDIYRASYETADQFERHLEEMDVSIEELRIEFRRSITLETLLAREITAKMSVSENEMKAYYEENKASFHLAEQQIHLAQILVTPTPEIPIPNHRNNDARDPEAAQAKAEMLMGLLRAGQPFEVVAQHYSEDPDSVGNGGDLGFIPQSFLEETDLTLRRVVALLSPGEISPIIKSGSALRIFRLIAREPAGQRIFSDPRVQQSIRETLENRKNQLLRTAYTEVLRNEADVTNYLAKSIVADFATAN